MGVFKGFIESLLSTRAKYSRKWRFDSLVLISIGLVFIFSFVVVLAAHHKLLHTSDRGPTGRARCDFNYARDWDSLEVPSCASEGEAKSFLMTFFGESGSTAILSTTMQHSRVYQMNESQVPEMAEMELIEETPVMQKLPRMNAYFANATKAGKIPGFKFRPENLWVVRQLDPKYKPRILWNYRRNNFQKALGEVRKAMQHKPSGGLKGQSWLEYCKEHGVCSYKVDIDRVIKQIRAGITVDKEVNRVMRTLGSDCILPVAYEELDECPERLFAQIYKFLGVGYERHEPAFTKSSGVEACHEIENWDEVCDAFMPCSALRWQIDPHFTCKCLNVKSSRLSAAACPIEWNEELSNFTNAVRPLSEA